MYNFIKNKIVTWYLLKAQNNGKKHLNYLAWHSKKLNFLHFTTEKVA